MVMEEGVVLAHLISSQGIQIDLAKIEVISTLPMIEKKKDVWGFLGHAKYYRSFINNFSQLVAPLCTLLKKDSELSKDSKCATYFL